MDNSNFDCFYNFEILPISYVLVKEIGTLLWLSLSQEKLFRQRLVTETKRFTLKYLQSYFPSESNAT